MKTIASAAIAVAALALTACSSPLPADPEAAFIAELGQFTHITDVLDEDNWIELGHIACREWEGMSKSEVASFIEEQRSELDGGIFDTTMRQYRLVVKYLCPEQAEKLP